MVKISRKKFNTEAKRLKRKNHLTASDARDRLARDYGYRNFAFMEHAMCTAGEWKQ